VNFFESHNLDQRVRTAAFGWLSSQVAIHGDVLPRDLLAGGFDFEGTTIPLVSPQGIFKPKILDEIPLTITTTTSGPYDDGFDSEGLLHYRYRGIDPLHRDNVGLRQAMQRRIPLIYFHGIAPGKYLAVWPVFIVGDNPHPTRPTFSVEVDDMSFFGRADPAAHKISDQATEARRHYITCAVKQRVHQRRFRERVLHAYRDQCSLCRLRHKELLDAAHIIPDEEPGGEPTVDNGIALCKLHHAAFDRFVLAIRPDYVIEIREDILKEHDGPMLLHGLQGMHNERIVVPRSAVMRPNRVLLEQRYERFREAS